MDIFVAYTFAMFSGIVVAWSISQVLSQFPFGVTYRDGIVGGLILALTLFYFFRQPYLLLATIEKDLASWELAVGISWAICALGLPTVLPRIWAAVLTTLRDGAYQWVFTIIAAILTYIVFTLAQWFADYTIQSIMQTHPDQFPGAQRMLTAIAAVYGWIIMFYSIAMLATFVTPMVKMRSTGNSFLSMTAVLPMFFALFVVVPNAFLTYQKASSTDKPGRHARRWSVEDLILWTSFMPNQVVEGVLRSEAGEVVQQTHLACRNLPPEVYVAFVHPDEVVPDKVVVAGPRSGAIVEDALAYSYHVSVCENSINPSGIK